MTTDFQPQIQRRRFSPRRDLLGNIEEPHTGIPLRCLVHLSGGVVRTAVIDNNKFNFINWIIQIYQRIECSSNHHPFIMRRNHQGNFRELRIGLLNLFFGALRAISVSISVQKEYELVTQHKPDDDHAENKQIIERQIRKHELTLSCTGKSPSDQYGHI